MSKTVVKSLEEECCSSNILHHLRKRTFEVRLESTYEKNWCVNVPTRSSTEPDNLDFHSWEFNIIVYKAEDEPYGRVLVSGKQIGRSFKYSRDFCEIKVENDDGECFSYKGPLLEPNYHDFVAPPLNFTGVMYKDIQNLTVKVTLGSSDDDVGKCASLKDMYDNSILTDIVIMTSDKDFPCHKVALAVVSDYFRKMFQAEMIESAENVVNWKDVVDTATVEDLLFHVYTGETPPNIENTCVNLIDAASLCLMDDLRDICVANLSKAINVDNSVEILQLCEKYNLLELKRKTVTFVVQNYHLVVESASWKSLDPETAMKLMSEIIFTMRDEKK